MSVWLISFIISGLFCSIFLLLKIAQDKFSVLLFWPDARNYLEIRLQRRKYSVDSYVKALSAKNFYIVLHMLVAKLKKVLVRLVMWLDGKSHVLLNIIRGKQQIESKNTSSYFLHDIASYKKRFRKK